MAASGAMWVKPTSGPLAGKLVVLTMDEQSKLAKGTLTKLKGGAPPGPTVSKHIANIKLVKPAPTATKEKPAPTGPVQHTMELTKNNGQKVTVTGELKDNLLVHPAINQPGKWEVTQASTGKHVAHAVDEATAKKVAEVLADDPNVGPGLKAGDTSVLQDANHVAHLVKHNQYVKPAPPIETPAPPWNEPHKTFSNYKEADQFLAQALAPQYAKLTGKNAPTSSELSALSSYQGAGYDGINSALWSGMNNSQAARIDSLMKKIGGAPDNMTIVRAEHSGHKLYAQAAKLEVGDPYVSLGFHSTHNASASGWSWTAGHNDGVRIFYRVPKGTPMVHMNSMPGYYSSHTHEGEVLLGRNLTWKVVGKKVIPSTNYGGSPKIELTVELIGQLTTGEASALYQTSMNKPKSKAA